MTARALLPALAAFVALALSGCGEEDIATQNIDMASGLGLALEVEAGSPHVDVVCYRPREKFHECSVFVPLREGLARVVEYDVKYTPVTEGDQWTATATNDPGELSQELTLNPIS